MTMRSCHFHDGCAWPDQYGGRHCDCKRIGLADFNSQPSRNERAWGLVAVVWVPLLILGAAVLWVHAA